jgi:peptide/nickel transport system permease protein
VRSLATAVLILFALIGAAAPFVAPYPPDRQFADLQFAPPMRPHIRDESGRWRTPFVYPLSLADRLERRYVENRTHPAPIEWIARGSLARLPDGRGPLLLLGSDSFGRDVFSRLIWGARVSLGVAILGALGALLLGTLAGGIAGYRGGPADEALMRIAEFVLVLPLIYVVLALRAVLPLVVAPSTVFWSMVAILSLAGWPHIARGVRAIVRTERGRDYVDAAISIGAGPARVLMHHVLPAARGFLTTQALLLLPAFVLAEATLSYLGLGFAEPTPSWGAMLSEAANVRAMAEFPWVLSPAAAIVIVVLAVNLRSRARTVSM